MFAVIQTPGRQYPRRAGRGDRARRHAAKPAQAVTFDQVLLVGKDAGEMLAGAPFVAGAKVVGVVVEAHRGPKVRIFKKKRRKQYRRTAGPSQPLTRVRITEIVA